MLEEVAFYIVLMRY